MNCEHLNWDNQKDCENKAKYMCQCCGAGVCEEHYNGGECPYGGMDYIKIEDKTVTSHPKPKRGDGKE